MPRTKEITVYTFDELSDEAKERARQWWREGAFDHEWWDATYEDAKTCFALLGFEIDNIYFSGFWSQGDGACFEGKWRASDVKPGQLQEHAPTDEELHRIAAEIETLAKDWPAASFTVKQRGHYSHDGCTEFEFDYGNDEAYEGVEYESPRWKELNAAALAFRLPMVEAARSAMKWIYRQLEKEYDYQNADEQVDENIRINEYEFTAKGKRCVVI
jgi:hypothetical protein